MVRTKRDLCAFFNDNLKKFINAASHQTREQRKSIDYRAVNKTLRETFSL